MRAALSSCALYLCITPALAKGTDVAATDTTAGTTASTGYDIPTGAPPSPLFGAQPFTQKMLMFEEFGVRAMPTEPNALSTTFAPPATCQGAPMGWQVDKMIKQVLWPLPTRMARTDMPSPWAAKVGSCIGQPLQTSAIEGRPSGELYAHQRYDEFMPKVYFSAVQTGARLNNGARDGFQRHKYAAGEFGPGGLYYNTAGAPGFEGTTKGIDVRFHPNFPVQQPNSVWTFDGTMPPKLLVARYGEPILFRHYNGLPIDVSANGGFGQHTITTHEHNGHNPAESDGFAAAYFYPGQFYDYRWPMVLAGHDSINTTATNNWAGAPNGAGGIKKVAGDWHETMSTHWFHDHMLDFTAQNVYKGNAAMMTYYSAIDRGNESIGCRTPTSNTPNLCLPSGTALDWGNRDYDVNLVVADKAWDSKGQLFFNIFNLDGFLGDQVLVNWSWKPYLDVRARRYRFRILDGSVSRYFKIALVTAAGQRVPFHLIANDGNIMEHAVAFPNAQSQDLPVMGIAERMDIVVDFSQFAPGTKLYFVNTLEHQDGKGPKGNVPLADILSGKYQGDPAVGKFMEFRVREYTGTDLSMNPADFTEGKRTMIPRPAITPAEITNARHRKFEFGRSGGTDTAPWTIKTDNGVAGVVAGGGLGADIKRTSVGMDTGLTEIWSIENNSGGWSHPVHVHFEEGRILSRDGKAPPIWERWARKDVYRVGPGIDSSAKVEVAIRFREFLGTFMEHCHNTQHEDHSMLLRWDIIHPGQTLAVPTPEGGWEGTFWEPSYVLPGWRNGIPAAGTPAQ
ncbi:MAG: multicopper oxidase domain-containing protein [Hyphomonadaceae bacterium]